MNRNYIIIAATLFFTNFFGFEVFGQILSFDTEITISSDVKSVVQSFRIRVNNKSQSKLSAVSIAHSPEQKFELLYARILDVDGNQIRKLKKKEISTRSNRSQSTFFEDNLVQEFNLYSSSFPYHIEYAYRLTTEDFIYVENWQPFILGEMISRENSLKLNIPTEYKIDFESSGNFEFQDSSSSVTRTLIWNITLDQFPKLELFSPGFLEQLPSIDIVPLKFKYVVPGSATSWNSFGQWQEQLNQGVSDLPLTEKIILDDLIVGLDNDKDKDKVRKLYHYLQDNTQYVSVDINAGGLKSYPASYVCRNKYGDCKALTTYMQSMLEHLGIPSFYTLIKAGANNSPINPNLPSQQFNHAILIVPLADDTIWLENTSSTTPFNYMGTFTQDRQALVIHGNKSKLISTPKLFAQDVLCKSSYSYQIIEDGGASFDIISTLRGKLFENHQYLYFKESKEEQTMVLLRDLCPTGSVINDWKRIDSDRDNPFVEFHIQGDQANIVSKIGELLIIKPKRISLPPFEKPKMRKNSVRLRYPINKQDSVIYKFKSLDQEKVQLPDNFELTTRFGTYKASYSILNNRIILAENLLINKATYPVEEYSSLYSFIDDIRRHQNSSIILSP